MNDYIIEAYVYTKTHYYFYSGFIIRMLIDKRKRTIWSGFKHIIISLLIVDLTIKFSEYQQYPYNVALFICLVLGFLGDPFLRFILDDFINEFLIKTKKDIFEITTAITNWIVRKFK